MLSRRKIYRVGGSSFIPIHPNVLPVLIRTFRRFGQNERSLFSFLLSNEPFGLAKHSRRSAFAPADLYRLHDLLRLRPRKLRLSPHRPNLPEAIGI